MSVSDDSLVLREDHHIEDYEAVQIVPLTELHTFKNHPFKVTHDEQMETTIASIQELGVLTPAIARPRTDGGYELISGHRRRFACEALGLATMPVIIRDLTDDEAVIAMVDSNIQRETLLPSERAYAYQMKLDALKRQGVRTDIATSRHNVAKLGAADEIGQQVGVSGRQIQRIASLTRLVPELMSLVDEGRMGETQATELAQLTADEQVALLDAIDSEQAVPSVSQAKRIKKMHTEGTFDVDVVRSILSEEKKPPRSPDITFPRARVEKWFPKSYSNDMIAEKMIKITIQAVMRARKKAKAAEQL